MINKIFIVLAFLLANFFTVAFAAIESEHKLPRFGPELDVNANTSSTVKSENLDKVVKFVKSGNYLGWKHDPYIRPTGDIYRTPDKKLIDGMTHHRVRIYYSPDVADWMKHCRNDDVEVKSESCEQDKGMSGLPDGSTIVKEMYKTVPPSYPEDDPVIGWAVMVKKNGASHDGWFWVIYFREEFRSMDTMGTFSYSFCLTCHASTTGQNTFVSYKNLTGDNASSIDQRSYVQVAEPLLMQNLLTSSEPRTGDMKPHLTSINPNFEKLYKDKSIYNTGSVPEYSPVDTGPVFPNSDYDHVWNTVAPKGESKSYLTSDNCIGCHDATNLVETQTPNMLIKQPHTDPLTGKSRDRLLNLSIYSEWRSSPMGMAGRDPIFFSQLESEIKTYPEKAQVIQNKCLSCHGAMGQRQYHKDRNKPENKNNPAYHSKYFDMSMVFAKDGPHAKYGALARDGISCMICHQMNPDEINQLPSEIPNSGQFTRPENHNIIYGSTPDNEQPGGAIRTHPMQQALGFTPTYNKYVDSPNMCGACHTISLNVGHPEASSRFLARSPVANDDHVMMSEAHEQDTYLEWLYSAYQTVNPEVPINQDSAASCQACHMPKGFQNDKPLATRIANVEDANWPIPAAENLADQEEITIPPRPEIGRHSFFGMNLFVLSFYQQFTKSIFGLEPDTNPPEGTVSAQDMAIEDGLYQARHLAASVNISKVEQKDKKLISEVRINNLAGHRLPSGVGFRRAWLEFNVLDENGKVLWASGSSNDQGVILDSPEPDAKPLTSEFTNNWKELQPHWDVISRQDQAQIYEERYVNQYGEDYRLNTSFLGLGMVVKDNRLLPKGYQYSLLMKKYKEAREKYESSHTSESENEMEKYQSLLPESLWGRKNHEKLPESLHAELPLGALNPNNDDSYTDSSGSDIVKFEIPLSDVVGATRVVARLNYQNIPPYYLRDRFQIGAGGEQTQRLYYLVGHTKTEGTPIEGWKIKVAEDKQTVPIILK